MSSVKHISALQFISQPINGNHLNSVKKALEAGVNWIQLRMKNMSYNEMLSEAKNCKELCKSYHATFIINDHIELAKEIKADGIHLGKTDSSPTEARAILGNNVIIGGTANTLEDCLKLNSLRVDYIGLGPFRFTTTKKNLSPVLGFEGYQIILNQLRLKDIQTPIIGIGGIRKEDIQLLFDLGIDGIAVSSLIMESENPEALIPLLGGARGGSLGNYKNKNRRILPYNPSLKEKARELRNNSTLSEILLWNRLKKNQLGVDFDRQRPIDNYIVDFYCKDLMLAIEIDGQSHDYKYNYDKKRQGKLEQMGVQVLRFDDLEVKQDIENVIRTIEYSIEHA